MVHRASQRDPWLPAKEGGMETRGKRSRGGGRRYVTRRVENFTNHSPLEIQKPVGNVEITTLVEIGTMHLFPRRSLQIKTARPSLRGHAGID